MWILPHFHSLNYHLISQEPSLFTLQKQQFPKILIWVCAKMLHHHRIHILRKKNRKRDPHCWSSKSPKKPICVKLYLLQQSHWKIISPHFCIKLTTSLNIFRAEKVTFSCVHSFVVCIKIQGKGAWNTTQKWNNRPKFRANTNKRSDSII